MAQNPLIGSRISLISKKNIRYEGTLYSINEQDATVALQNVKSYGTEGREQQDPAGTFVPTQDAIHPYLVFRGSDIKDLHVHERVQPPQPASSPPQQQQKPTTAKTTAPANGDSTTTSSSPEVKKLEKSSQPTSKNSSKSSSSPSMQKKKDLGGNSRNNENKTTKNSSSRSSSNNKQRGWSKKNPQHQVGTGASLLNRKARGVVDSANILPTPEDDFDFESNLANFEKEEEDNENEEEQPQSSYEKDDFFDSISCDALDRQRGKDNRLRGAQERSLNTETFGAVALNSNRRYNRRGRGGYRGRGGGRGRGRGGGGNRRGRGRGRYHGNSGRGTQVTTHNRAVAAS